MSAQTITKYQNLWSFISNRILFLKFIESSENPESKNRSDLVSDEDTLPGSYLTHFSL
jgi:hypothetical protein